MKIIKLIIPLLYLSQIANANNQELLQLEKEKSVDTPCQVLSVENEPEYFQQVIKFEPKTTQEITSQDRSDEPKVQVRKEILYSQDHKHWDDNLHCYGGWAGDEPRTSFTIYDYYFCDNPKPYWKEDEWAPKNNLRFHDDILATDWNTRGISSVEIDIIYRSWWRSTTYIVSSYVINYDNGTKEVKNLTNSKNEKKS